MSIFVLRSKTTKRYKIFAELVRDIGTSRQISDRTGINLSTVQNYLSSMKTRGWAAVSHIYEIGNPCFVWKITDEGLKYFEDWDG